LLFNASAKVLIYFCIDLKEHFNGFSVLLVSFLTLCILFYAFKNLNMRKCSGALYQIAEGTFGTKIGTLGL